MTKGPAVAQIDASSNPAAHAADPGRGAAGEASSADPPAAGHPKKRGNLGSLFRLAGYLRPYRGWFTGAVAALFLTAMLSLAFPFLIGSMLGGGLRGGGVQLGGSTYTLNTILTWLLVALALQAFIAYFRIGWFAKAGEQALADARRAVYGRLVRLPMGFFGNTRVGELSSRVAADLEIVRETLITTLPQMIRHSVILTGGLIFITLDAPRLAVFMLACLPVVVIAVAIFGRRIRQYSREAQDRLADSNVVLNETLGDITTVKAYRGEASEEQRFGHALHRFIDAALTGARARAAFVSFIIFVLFGVIALVVWYGARMVDAETVTEEQFMRFLFFSIFVGGSFGAFPEIMGQLNKASGAGDRIVELLDEPVEAVDSQPPAATGTPTPFPRVQGAIEFDQVGFSYPARPDVPVLHDISFQGRAGERIALVGPSGAGKSTLTQLLMRFYDPAAGAIRIDGRDLRDFDLGELRQQMAVVPQEVLLFGGSIFDNIRYGKPSASRDEVVLAAKQANAWDFIDALPEGLETQVGDRGVKLSGGQRQRIAIARAILVNPAILILDEATSSLDAESERLVQRALGQLMEGRTSIIIAHRLATVRHAHQIIVLKDGRVAEHGTHGELIDREGGLYHMLARLQFGLG